MHQSVGKATQITLTSTSIPLLGKKGVSKTDGPNENYKTWQASDPVYSLVAGLPLAPLRALSIYSVCRFIHISAVTPDGPNEKYKTLHASDSVLSLVKLEDAGLAASTGAGAVDLFIISAATLDGPNGKYKTLRSCSSVLQQSDAHGL
jgi:hypothetical protein